MTWMKRMRVFIFLALVVLLALPVAAADDFLGGDGSAGKPYLIADVQGLDAVRKRPDACFRLVDDIAFSDANFAEGGLFYNDGAGWQPIEGFTGTFDGDGHAITGLRIKADAADVEHAGLFGSSSGTIRALHLQDVQIRVELEKYTDRTAVFIGGIAADNQGLIEDCSVQGSLQMDGLSTYVSPNGSSSSQRVALDGYLGGIAGQNGGTIQNCANLAQLEELHSLSSSYNNTYKSVGGIAALNTGAIARCRNSGSVKNGQYTGGIAARSAGGVENCFNTGIVAAIAPSDDACSYGGGICGVSSGSVRACYSAGRIPFPGDDPCVAQNTGSVQSCYFYEHAVSDVGGGLSDGQMRNAASYDGFDFDAVWELDGSTGYPFPVLKNAPRLTVAQDTDNFGGGSGQPWDAYLVSTAEHLRNIRLFPDACFRLTDDITVTAADYGEPFDFSGVLDGGGCRVRVTFPETLGKIAISGNSGTGFALFTVNSGRIHDLDVTLSADYDDLAQNITVYLAAVAAMNDASGVIQSCHVDGSFSVQNSGTGIVRIGGIAARNDGTIAGCTNGSIIRATCPVAQVGGIVGYCEKGSVTGCENTGAVTAALDQTGADNVSFGAGGIIGVSSLGIASDCVNAAPISATVNCKRISGTVAQFDLLAQAGGIIGWWATPNSGKGLPLTDCENTGAITASAETGYSAVRVRAAFAGGIVGCAGYSVTTRRTLNVRRAVRLEGCRNSGTVTAGNSNVTLSTSESAHVFGGGIAGACNSTITRCANTAGAWFGISGRTPAVTYCYNTGSTVDGLKDSGDAAENSYDTGAGPKGSTNLNTSPRLNTKTHSYFAKGTKYQSADTALTDAQARVESSYTGFDFENDWVILPGSYPYPQLRCNLQTPLSAIYIAEQPAETVEYAEGQFYMHGLTLGIRFADGPTGAMDARPEFFSQLDTSKKGTQTIHLTFLGLETTGTLDVLVRDKRAASIELGELPAKMLYFRDEAAFDPTGGTIRLVYNNGSFDTITLTAEMVTGFRPGVIGEQALTVTCAGMTCELPVTVYDIQSLKVSTPPDKTDYVLGQPLNLTGGELTVTYTTERMPDKTVALTDPAVTCAYDKSKTGTVAITAAYMGKTAVFSIAVRARVAAALELRTKPDKLVYAPGEALDLTGGQLRVVFASSNQYEQTLPLTDAAVTGYDPGKPGLQTLTVSYCGASTTFKILVSDPVESSVIAAESGGVRLTLALNKAQTARAVVCAYRNGQLVTAHLTTDAELSVLLKRAQESDTFVLFLLDEAHCPILKSQPLN